MRNGKPDGLVRTWFENGCPESEMFFLGGLPHGEVTYWHSNGNLKKRGVLRRGKEEGEWSEWHANGQLSSRGTYRGGVMDGLAESWHENGVLRSQMQTSHGEGCGVVRYWHANGNPHREVGMRRGELHGRVIEYFETGEKSTEWVLRGGLHTQIPQAWDSSGDRLLHSFFSVCPACGARRWRHEFPLKDAFPCAKCGFCLDLREPVRQMATRAATWVVEPLARAGLPDRFWEESADIGAAKNLVSLPPGLPRASWNESALKVPDAARGLAQEPNEDELREARRSLSGLESEGLTDDLLYAVVVIQRIGRRRVGPLAGWARWIKGLFGHSAPSSSRPPAS